MKYMSVYLGYQTFRRCNGVIVQRSFDDDERYWQRVCKRENIKIKREDIKIDGEIVPICTNHLVLLLP